MEKETKVVEFTTKQNLQYENSYCILKNEEGVILNVTIGIRDEDEGWFECYSDDGEWYAEGCLWFDGKELTDYDGVFSLPDFIMDKLEEMGYDVKDMRESLS
jgi:hypothetical protein